MIKLTNKDILKIALEQSSHDANCKPKDFLKETNVITISKKDPLARKYLILPHACNLISYGDNIVATISSQYQEIIENYLCSFSFEHCFETPALHVLDESFKPYGLGTCFMAEYYLPDINNLKALPCNYKIDLLSKKELTNIDKNKWPNALFEDPILALGAYDRDELIALATCFDDCATMWQIGIDVLKKYRKQNIASSLISTIAIKALEQDKVPFYCCAWSNIASKKTALKAGFKPAWVELTIKPLELINKINHEENDI